MGEPRRPAPMCSPTPQPWGFNGSVPARQQPLSNGFVVGWMSGSGWICINHLGGEKEELLRVLRGPSRAQSGSKCSRQMFLSGVLTCVHIRAGGASNLCLRWYPTPKPGHELKLTHRSRWFNHNHKKKTPNLTEPFFIFLTMKNYTPSNDLYSFNILLNQTKIQTMNQPVGSASAPHFHF